MQRRHNYPARRTPFDVVWHATGAGVDTEPLPLRPDTAARTRSIRRLFLDQFYGHGRIDDIGAAAEDAGLLDGLTTSRSMRETVMAALRPIATSKPSARTPGLMRHGSPPG